MRKICQILVGLSLLWSVAALAIDIDVPTYDEGSTWTIKFVRKSPISRSNVIPSGTYRVMYEKGKFLWYSEVSNELVAEGPQRIIPLIVGDYDVPVLKFPMELGGKWSYEYFNNDIGRRGMRLSGTVTVSKEMKKITVAAGTLNAYELKMEEWGSGVKNRTFTYYYAVSCGCIAKFLAEFSEVGATYETELLNYKVKRDINQRDITK